MKNFPVFNRKTLKDWPLFTALVTPFRDGGLDMKAYDALLENQIKAQNGLLILGSTAEAFSLSVDEKAQILRQTIDRQRESPVVVSITASSFREVMRALELEAVQGHAVQGLLLALPPYYRPGPNGQLAFFKAVLDASPLPIILYNHPGRVGVSIDPRVLADLEGHPNFLALKQSSPDLTALKDIQLHVPTLPIYLGDDSLVHPFRQENIAGLISVMANAWPKETKIYLAQCLENRASQLPIFEALEQAVNPIPIKTVLSHRMQMTPDVRLPLCRSDLQCAEKIEFCIKEMHTLFGGVS